MIRTTARTATTIVTALVVAVGAACTGENGEPAGADPVAGRLSVFADASLTEVFAGIGKDFEAAHPAVTVIFTFAGSAALAQRITAGAPADVFASASPANITQVTPSDQPIVFARNQLVIAVPRGNPKGLRRLADLGRPGIDVAVCAEQVPCGAAARTVLDAGRVGLSPAAVEPDVKATLARLRLGEVDAALVYRTDATAAFSVEGVEFAESARAINDYPIVALATAANPAGAKAFVSYVRSAPAREALTAAGFQKP